MTYLSFTVPGIPIPQGSKRHVGNGRMIEANPGLKPWREAIMAAAIEAADANEDWVSTGSRRATYQTKLYFTFPRPKAHYGAGGNVKNGAPHAPGVKPDLDKLIRSVFDALTQSGVIGDDSQMVRLIAIKCYGERPHLTVDLERLT